MRTVAVVQARMGSTRLPGKVMKVLGNKRAIGWAVNAAMNASGVDMVVVATSENEENDVLESWCNKNGVRCFRGSEDDVLKRYCGLISYFDADIVVRLTADCPLLDPKVIGEAIALHRTTGATYTTNQWPPNWPDGLDVEVIEADALLEADEEATSLTDRECVTQYIYRNQTRWPCSTLACPIPNLHKERWVLDSPEDLELLRMIIGSFPENWEPNYIDILNLLDKNPEWRKINLQWTRNQRFFESLSEERTPPKTFYKGERLLQRALKVIPNGSQTFSKSCLSYPHPGAPLFASHGSGGYIFDVDGNRYVDLVGGLLPNILGYSDPDVDWAIRTQLDKGICPSLATDLEAKLSETLVDLIPCAEMVRFGKNGSDAVSAAVRLARFHTKNDLVGIIAGEGYHGWHDWAVANTIRNEGVPGLTEYFTHRIEPDINKIIERLCRHCYAAIVIDPENHSHTLLDGIKNACASVGTILIYDEIRTGFRYALGGYQEYVGVIPDLACFGKSMGNGMPISALVGSRHLMSALNAKDGPFWSGTYFGETLSIAAAIATIAKIRREGVIEYIAELGSALMEAILDHVGDEIFSGSCHRPLITLNRDEDKQKFIKGMAQNGVLILNSNNFCFAHGKNELEQVISAYKMVV